MTTKVEGSTGIEFPDGSVQSSAAYSKAQSDGPAFKASSSSPTSVAGTDAWVGMAVQTEAFDTNSAYDPATSRFQPTIAGYYYVSLVIQVNSGAGNIEDASFTSGLNISGLAQEILSVVRDWSDFTTLSGMSLRYFNGTTDWVSPIMRHASGSAKNFSVLTFSGFLVRRA